MKKLKKLLKNRKLIISIVILVVLSLVVLRRNSQNKTTRPITETVTVGNIASTVTASGQVLASGRLEINTQTTGVVKNVYVQHGDTVTAGQKIAEITLDSPSAAKSAQAWANYLSAKSTLEGSQATAYSLQSDMFAKWRTFFDLAEGDDYDALSERTVTEFYIPENDWLAAEAKYKNQQNVVAAAKASVASSWLSYQQVSPIIYSPGVGTVADITIIPGMVLSNTTSTSTTNTHIGTVINNSNAIVAVNLSEVDVSKVKIHSKVVVTVDAFPGINFSGFVAGINTSGIVESGVTNFPATIALDETDTTLLPNMAATAVITLEEKQNVLLVPAAALITRGNTTNIRVINNGTIDERQVETGIASDSYIEIVSGVNEGDTIIVGSSASGATSNQSQGNAPFGVFRLGGTGGNVRTGGARQGR